MAARELGPATLAVVRAVAAAARPLSPGTGLVAACSGGPDSLALAAATARVARRSGRRAGAVVVDHRLQAGSAEVAAATAAALGGLGFPAADVLVEAVDVGPAGGPEAAARAARYAALCRAAVELAARWGGPPAVLLGHTRDDQAETVLLGLARGSGTRSLAGMAPASGRYLRPLLALPRSTTRAACAELGLSPFDDPQNADPAFTRSRLRRRVLPVLEAELGPGIAAALARTAALARADADALDELARHAAARCGLPADAPPGTPVTLDVAALAALAPALRGRVLRAAAVAAGSPADAVGFAQVRAVEALVCDWHGQRGVDLPGRVTAARAGHALRVARR